MKNILTKSKFKELTELLRNASQV